MLGLITELLDIARIEADQLDLSPEPISVRAAVHEALGLIAPDADKHGIALQPASIDGPWTVRADAQRLRQVLLNLLSNAVKFNRPGGQVQVSAQADGEQMRITVADQDAGLTRHRSNACLHRSSGWAPSALRWKAPGWGWR